MNLYRRYLLGASVALTVAATQAWCVTLFSDDFTNQTTTNSMWMKTNTTANASTTVNVNGGSLTMDNTGTSVGEFVHYFGANGKPAAFTLSYILKSVEKSPAASTEQPFAGALFCRQSGDYPSGYLLTVSDGLVLVYKVTSTIIGTSVNISTSLISYKQSLDLNSANNKLTVSTNGSSFHIFANDVFQFSFSDNSYGPGDVSMLLFQNTKAVFGNVLVTDEFNPGSGITTFSDDFDDNEIHRYWQRNITAGGTAATITETGGKLRMTAAPSPAAYIYINIDLTDFEASVEVNHVSGELNRPYGFFLVGDNAATQMVKFVITGGRYYAIFKPGDTQYDFFPNPIINGSTSLESTDNLTIKKKDNSNYEFFANGNLLATVGPVNFPIKGIGLLCENDLTIAFDNFYVKQNYQTSVRQNDKRRLSRRAPTVARGHVFYDMRGRKRYAATSAADRTQIRAAGVYVNKNGRDVAVRKGRIVGVSD